MDCPKCLGRLQKTTIKAYEVHDVKALEGAGLSYELEVDQCFVCKGVWLDKGELDKYLKEGITVIDSPSLGHEMDKQLNDKKGKCPRCTIELVKQASSIDSRIFIDICKQCQGIWLDSTEIDLLESSVGKGSSFLAGLKKMFFSN